MTALDKEKFSALCRDDAVMYGSDADGIGTYNEKRLHRILKRYVTNNAQSYEVKLAGCVADVFEDGHITEIQTSSFRPLEKKIKRYVSETDCKITVVHPIIFKKKIIKANKETGEIISEKTSPKHGKYTDVLPNMYYLRELADGDRLEVRLLSVGVEEYRFSERVRYRKKGAYDNDVRPVELFDEISLIGAEAYANLLPERLSAGEFTSAELSSATGLKGRRLSLAVAFLVSAGIVTRRAEGKKFFYKLK